MLFVLLLPVRSQTRGSYPVMHRYLDEAFSFWHAARYTAQDDDDDEEEENEKEEEDLQMTKPILHPLGT